MANEEKSSNKAAKSSLRELATKQANKKQPRRLRSAAGKVSFLLVPFKFIGKIGRFIIPPYFRNSWKELKEVTWPSRKETRQLTLAVFVFAIIFGALITITDYGLDKVFRKVLLK
ncbi:MAG: Protein translocase subunit SecE [Candidatus Saccharibacteria bacterium]|nr:Protein translocase subunit SecE [Candidatus Saccharibacteria bacterium]